MEVKTFEIRDSATFVPAVAVRIDIDSLEIADRFLFDRLGYGRLDTITYLMLECRGKFTHDPNVWGDRTFTVAHNYIIHAWDTLKSGDVVDVQYILGETVEKKISERLEVI